MQKRKRKQAAKAVFSLLFTRLSKGLDLFMTRLWLRSSALLLCLVQFIAAAKYSQAAERASGEKLFPKDTLAFFTVSNVPEMKKKWDKTSVGQMLHDAQLKPFLDDVKKKIDEGSKQVEDEIGVSLNDLLDLPQGEVSLAVMEQPARKFGFVLLLEYGDKQETVDKLLKKMAEELKKEEAEHSTEEIDKVTLHVYSLKSDDENPFKTLTYFVDEKCLVFSNEVAAIKEVLSRWDGDSDDTLAQNDQFSHIMTQCKPESGEPLIKMFMSPIGLINTGISVAQNYFPQAGMVAGFLPMFGLDAMKGWGGTLDFDEGDFEGIANFYFYCDSTKGLMGLFNFPGHSIDSAKMDSCVRRFIHHVELERPGCVHGDRIDDRSIPGKGSHGSVSGFAGWRRRDDSLQEGHPRSSGR